MKPLLRSHETQYYSLYPDTLNGLHNVFRTIGNSVQSDTVRRLNLGYLDGDNRRGNLAGGLELLRDATTPNASRMNITRPLDTSTSGATAMIMQSLRTDVAENITLLTGDSRATISRQVTLTDFCFPDAEMPGLIILSIRHPLDINSEALYATPAGRDPRVMETVWYELSELAAVSVNRVNGSGVRPSLVSLSFLIAARASDYADKCGAEALRAHVISNYGRRRMEEKLDRFGICLITMLRCRVFPHRHFQLLGGLISWISQREIASITAVVRGPQESIKTEQTAMPRSSVYVPACAYIDFDKDIRVIHEERSSSSLYLVFVYTQKFGRETVRIYVMRSRLGEWAFREGLGYMYSGVRSNNAITGVDGLIVPHGANVNMEFPLTKTLDLRNRDRRLGIAARSRDLNKADWKVDLRGRPTKESCMYAAYCRLGHLDESSVPVKKFERCGSLDIPVIWIPGVIWNIGTWIECY
ncbi:capsid protein [Gallid alphaherpesvirus 2]|uniref:Triplex capsid protein 1 n=2 Tax=Gallid alphaherpesvirus 2 TaxID=10390 RepID=TRX1_GAHVM|nr:capsid triplex subunit 1 [Gallid alphaherpesvirus 2]Q9E6N1.1 RecName: Full=Triplex capsid protein 1 [Marek's disease herpesvirus type 1 strain MD5]ACF49562.1 UL38 [synthetic construct]AAG14231.1 UL38 capsid protein-like protein [Gallid alphaherpesvirus 2]AAL37963.1 capsid protein [Gallid alphaherpesvirus 2]AAS01680.1 VP19C capsid protein [Gallid alphaherpesvirus 2]ABR13123.1 UL38 [Gallid alphaherpesvirus 2]